MKKTSTIHIRYFLVFVALFFAFPGLRVSAQTKLATPRLTQAIDEANLVPMHTKVHPLARAEFDRGVVADSQPMNRMILILQRSPEQETALRNLMDEQQTMNSPNYHAWLTPAQFGRLFGVADADIQKVTAWLTQKGFTGIKTSPGNMFIEFSGTVGLVRTAFSTEIHSFMVNGEKHMANVSVPQMPAALSPVVLGIHSLHDFRKKSFMHYSPAAARAKAAGKLRPGYTASPCGSLGAGTTCFAMGPADFAKIYNLPPTTGAGALSGTGQTIAIVARSNINLQDITDFRTGFGLPANFTSSNIVLTGADPGIMQPDDGEATLDVEWSGAVAPNAKILLVVSESQATGSFLTDGVDYSAFYIVGNNLAPIVSESFGGCEANFNPPFDNFLWEQAAAQGITVMVSTGDSGSDSCDAGGLNATSGLSVSATASTPFNLAVGGTDFNDANNPGTFWAPSNTGSGLLSAKSYIPEITWNDSCAAAGSLTGCTTVDQSGLDLVGGSGGESTCGVINTTTGACISGYPKPTWQSAPGVPADGVRDIPDVSLFAAAGSSSGNFYIMCLADSTGVAGQNIFQNGQPCNLTGPNFNFTGVGGTSVSSPAFAGIVALVNQSEVTAGRLKAGEGQGNVNYVLYKLATAQAASPGNAACNSSTGPGASCTFNDITSGNNSVECQGGSPNCSNQTAGTLGVLVEPTGAGSPFPANTPAWTTTAGYDLATGLGSVNVTKLAANWGTITGNFVGSTTTFTAPASVNIAHGATVNFTVKVAQNSGAVTPTGDVSLIAEPTTGPQVCVNGCGSGGTLGTAPSPAGQVVISTNGLPGGTYPVVAHYAGDGTFAPSDSAGFSVTVSKENSTTQTVLVDVNGNVVTSVPYGSPYLFRMDVLGTQNGDNVICETANIPCPTGKITVTDTGGVALNDFLSTATGGSTNVASLNSTGFLEDRLLGTTGLIGGPHSYTASYSGDSSYNQSAAPALAITITPAATLTSVTANGVSTATVTTGQNVTLVATVAGCAVLSSPSSCNEVSNGAGPSGSVTFSTCGTATSCNKTVVPVSFNNSGAAADAFATGTLTTTFSTTGVQTITATFTTADTNYSSCAMAACEVGSAAVTVTASPAKVAFTVQPTNVVVGASITPAVKVSVEDASGNVVTSATNAITIAIGTNLNGGTLSGTLTANAVNGVATFSNLSINTAGTGYTLTAAAAGLTGATSSAFNVTSGAGGTFKVSYSPQPLVLNSTSGAVAALTVTVTPTGAVPPGAVTVTATAASLPPGVTCPNSPLTINAVAANPVAMTLNCMVTATSTSLAASNRRKERMFVAKAIPPTNTIPPGTSGKGWWTLSAGTGFAALFLLFLPGGRKKYRAALGLGLVCILSFTLGCSSNGGGVINKTNTVTKMTVTSAKVISPATFSFSVAVTGGTPTGQVQLFDGATMIGTAATVTGGVATPTAPALSVGTHAISAHYLGDTTTLASASGTLNLTETGSSTIAVTTSPTATPAAAAINITVN
jgi:subtilase family serine protease